MSEFYIGAEVGFAEDHDARGVVVDSHPERGWLVWWTWQEAARWHQAAALWLRQKQPEAPRTPEDELERLRAWAARWQEVAEHCDQRTDDDVLPYIECLETRQPPPARWLWVVDGRYPSIQRDLVDLQTGRMVAEITEYSGGLWSWVVYCGEESLDDPPAALALPLADAQRICEVIAEAIARRDSDNQGEKT